MKAARLKAYGDVDQFTFEDVPDPVPSAGEVLIKVAASGLNPVDLYVRQGYLARYYPVELPAILGIDAAGTVVSVGSAISGFAVGDRVAAHLPIDGRGTHAQLTVASPGAIARLAPNVGFEQGATLGVVSLTGRNAVNALEVKRGDRVLVSGALGSVGRAAVQYLLELGAVPVAGVRKERLAEGREIAGEAIDIDKPAISPDFDLAVSAAAPVAAIVLAHVRNDGRVATAVRTPEEANPENRVTVISINAHDSPGVFQAAADAMGRGELILPIAQSFELSQIAAAHQALAGNPRGKIILRH